jgi:hypothetical protein
MNSLVGWSRTLKATILLCSGKNILARTNTQMTSTTDNDAKTAAAKTAAATLTEHCVRSGKFHQLEDIQHFLIDEMDAKKCMARGGTARAGIRTAECAEAESFYKRILIMGHELLGFTAFRWSSSRNSTTSCTFKCVKSALASALMDSLLPTSTTATRAFPTATKSGTLSRQAV